MHMARIFSEKDKHEYIIDISKQDKMLDEKLKQETKLCH
jgi:sulfur transfer protein SufE